MREGTVVVVEGPRWRRPFSLPCVAGIVVVAGVVIVAGVVVVAGDIVEVWSWPQLNRRRHRGRSCGCVVVEVGPSLSRPLPQPWSGRPPLLWSLAVGVRAHSAGLRWGSVVGPGEVSDAKSYMPVRRLGPLATSYEKFNVTITP